MRIDEKYFTAGKRNEITIRFYHMKIFQHKLFCGMGKSLAEMKIGNDLLFPILFQLKIM